MQTITDIDENQRRRRPAAGDASAPASASLKIVVIGSGYVGLVAGACLAHCGHMVVCVDEQREKIERLREGIVDIYEPGLTELIAAGIANGRLSFTVDPADALCDAQAVFVAVGTPPRPADGHPDMRHVFSAAKAIAANAADGIVVIDKSTVPVGTGDKVEDIIRRISPGLVFAVVSNPEFLREGTAIADFTRPERLVIGANEEWARQVVTRIYGDAFAGVPKVMTDRRSAELLKYAANAFLAMKITFINEMADLCEAVDANVGDIAYGIGLDSRIGDKFLNAGPGYGGSCFPKDALALAKTARDHRVQLRTIEAVIDVNDNRKRAMALRIVDACGGSVQGRKIAILGLAFKPDTDDIRESPAVPIIHALQDFGAEIAAYDPQAMDNTRSIFPDIEYCRSPHEAACGADALVIITEWHEFKTLEFATLRATMNRPRIVDLRNLYGKREMMEAGFQYWSVGRKPGNADDYFDQARQAAE